ncbi:hypothetical protein ACFQ2Z_18650, partial [Paenibacillus timonensis]
GEDVAPLPLPQMFAKNRIDFGISGLFSGMYMKIHIDLHTSERFARNLYEKPNRMRSFSRWIQFVYEKSNIFPILHKETTIITLHKRRNHLDEPN